jgi:hypothetical protein
MDQIDHFCPHVSCPLPLSTGRELFLLRQGAFLEGKGYSAAAIQRKTNKQLLFDFAESHLQDLERKGILPKEK